MQNSREPTLPSSMTERPVHEVQKELEALSDEAGKRITPEMLSRVPLTERQRLRVEQLRRERPVHERANETDNRRDQMAAEESGWVIEHRRSEVSAPEYWAGNGWSKDNLRAIRFARKEDAERTRDGFDEDDPLPGEQPHRVAEHGWG